jgi:hypothetical protein
MPQKVGVANYLLNIFSYKQKKTKQTLEAVWPLCVIRAKYLTVSKPLPQGENVRTKHKEIIVIDETRQG